MRVLAAITRIGTLAAVCLALSGCPALWFLNIRNDADKPVIVTMEAPGVPLGPSEISHVQEVFTKKAMPGQMVRLPIRQVSGLADLEKQELVVRTVESGTMIARRTLSSLEKDARADNPDYPDIYLMVTKNRIEAAANQHPPRR